MQYEKLAGRFITLEGGEGTGKTTQIMRLYEHLTDNGVECLATREPGGTALGKKMRAILLDEAHTDLVALAELFIYEGDRAQHVQTLIAPAIRAGKLVLCDRYADSTVAYQAYGKRIDLQTVQTLNRIATAGVTPDLTLLLDIDPRIGLGRSRHRLAAGGISEGRFERETIEFHERLRSGYLTLATEEPFRFRVIDASGSEDQVSLAITQALCDYVNATL